MTDFRLNPASDTGIVGDNVTSDRTPQFIGTAGAGDKVELFQLISFTGTLTSGLPTVTGLSSTTGLAAGQAVTGTGIPSGTTILSVSSSTGTIMLSENATVSNSESLTATVPVVQNTAIAQPISFTGTLTSGSASVTGISSTTGLVAGQNISGTGIPSGTMILSVNSSTAITLSAEATASGSQSLTALTNDANGKPYDFWIQLPFTLINGTIELGVIVVDVLSGNASPLSNPVTVAIVSVGSDYNADSYADAALYSRGITFTGTLTKGSASVTGISSTTGLVAGASVTGTGVPSGTTILTVNSSTAITLSANATVTGSQSLTAPNLGQWLVQTTFLPRRLPLLLRSGSPAARPSAPPTSSPSRVTSTAMAIPIWPTSSPAPRPGIWMTRSPTLSRPSHWARPTRAFPSWATSTPMRRKRPRFSRSTPKARVFGPSSAHLPVFAP
ncbi:MAG: hypothetical protein ABSH35_31860 [Isosphaeraceae bacterium]